MCERVVPCFLRRAQQRWLHVLRFDRPRRIAVHANDVEHRFAIQRIASERSHALRNFRGLVIRFSGHQRGDGAADVAPRIGIVGHRERHQQRAEICVAESQRTVVVRILRDSLGRIARVVHQNFLRRDGHVHRMLESGDVECAVRAKEFLEIERREIARRVVEEHILRAGIRRVNPVC